MRERERMLVNVILKEEDGCGVADLFLFEMKFDDFCELSSKEGLSLFER